MVVSAYAPAARCPRMVIPGIQQRLAMLTRVATCLRACYGMSSTDLEYGGFAIVLCDVRY
eukprot:2590435-Rhodomonas_salina.1